MNKRIIHVVSSAGVSGVISVIRFLLLGMQERGYTVSLAHYGTYDAFCESLSKRGIRVFTIGRLPKWLNPLKPYWIVQNLKRIFTDLSPEIIHAHSFDADLLSARAAAAARGSLMVTCHSFSYLEWARNHLPQYERWSPAIRKYVSVCRLLEQQLSEIRPFPHDRLTTVYNAPDIRFFDRASMPERTACREKLGILPHEIAITCVANYHPVKGQEVLAEAFARLATTLPATKLVLVGREVRIGHDRSLKERVTALLGSSGLQDRSIMIEDCTDARPILAASDIYVQPSHQEGLSVALGEALASGLPAVVTSVGGNPEVVVHDRNGFVVPPANPEQMAAAIRRLAADEAKRKGMGERSFRFAETCLHPAVILDAYAALYEEVSRHHVG